MLWINDKAIQIDISFLVFILCSVAIILTIGFVAGLYAGRKLDHRLLKRNYFKHSIPAKQTIK